VATVGALPHEGDAAELESLYVHPSIRRQGWGRRLTMLVMDFARTTGKNRLVPWSDTRFSDPHRLYRGLGLRQIRPAKPARYLQFVRVRFRM